MNTLIETVKYFIVISAELTVLFLGISTVVAFVLMYLPQEKIKAWMSNKGILGNFVGAFVGSLTPFCACSTVRMTLGFLEIGVPFGAIMSFVIASPLLNPIIIAMLLALMGLKVAIMYFVIVFSAAIVFGIILEKSGMSKLVKNVRIKQGNRADDEVPQAFKAKLKLAFMKAWGGFYGILGYLFIGDGDFLVHKNF